MTQSPHPPSPYPPYQMYGPPPVGPAAPAKRASVLMWILSTLAVLFGICCAALMSPMIEQMKSGNVAGAPQADVDRLRDQISQMESQLGMPASKLFLFVGVMMLVAGGVMGTLAFFVRRGGRGAAVTAIVLDSLILIYFAINIAGSLFMGGNPGQLGMSLCVMAVPLALLGLLMHWLIQAARNAPLVAAARDAAMGRQSPYGRPAGYQAGFPMPPRDPRAQTPATPQAPSQQAPAQQQQQPAMPQMPPAGPPASTFGPAPFGIPPPPPDDTPAGRYGYATRPAENKGAPESTPGIQPPESKGGAE